MVKIIHICTCIFKLNDAINCIESQPKFGYSNEDFVIFLNIQRLMKVISLCRPNWPRYLPSIQREIFCLTVDFSTKENNNYSCSKLSLTYFLYIDVGQHPFSYSLYIVIISVFDLPWEIFNNDRNGNLKFESRHNYKSKVAAVKEESLHQFMS